MYTVFNHDLLAYTVYKKTLPVSLPENEFQAIEDRVKNCFGMERFMDFEFMILDWIQTLRTPFGDAFMPFVSSLANIGIVWILLALLLMIFPKTRRAGIFVALALLFNLLLCNILLKPLVARPRPFVVDPTIELLIPAPADYSFPSGHTAVSFAAVTALFLDGKKWLWVPVLVLAVLISFSRMYLYVHFPTDVLGGVLLGALAGCLGALLGKRLCKK